MARLHEIKKAVQEITGLMVFDANSAVEVMVTGDTPEMVPIVAAKLAAAGLPFSQSRHRKFKGAIFSIPLRNAGSAFHADLEFAS